MRQVEATGGFATIMKRGDPDRGSLILLIAQRGVPKALIQRRLGADFGYRWAIIAAPDEAESEKFRESTANQLRFDPDCWLIELDIADAERFIAETTTSP